MRIYFIPWPIVVSHLKMNYPRVLKVREIWLLKPSKWTPPLLSPQYSCPIPQWLLVKYGSKYTSGYFSHSAMTLLWNKLTKEKRKTHWLLCHKISLQIQRKQAKNKLIAWCVLPNYLWHPRMGCCRKLSSLPSLRTLGQIIVFMLF